MALLRFLFFAIIILYVLKLVFRILLPILFQSLVNKVTNAGPRREQQKRRAPEGSLNIDFIPPKDKEARAADKAGEFIDYEELK